MRTERFLMGRRREELSPDERAVLEGAMSEERSLPARHVLIRAGERVRHSTFLIHGFICRYMDDRDGHRQLVGIHVPGDFVDLHGYPMRHLDHDVATLGPVTVGIFPHDRLERVNVDWPHLTRMLWFSTLLDAAMHREWIFRLGRLGADGRVAHFFSELNARLELVGLSDGMRFDVPIVQADLAEACGITHVHANRVLRTLRERGLMTFAAGRVAIEDRAGLERTAEFDGDYLYRSRSGEAD